MRRVRTHGIIVDDEDIWLLATYVWHITSGGYAATFIDGKRAMIQHFIVGRPIDRKYMVIDHIDRNPLNNRRSNLRYATVRQNRENSKDYGPMHDAIRSLAQQRGWGWSHE